MNKIARSLFRKPTLFSTAGILLILTGIPLGLYWRTQEGLEGLGAPYAFTGVLAGALLLLADRLALQFAAWRKLNLLETGLLVVVALLYAYNNRRLIIEIGPEDYFVLIENNGTFRDSEMKPVFPFHKRVVAEGNSVVIGPALDQKWRISVESPADWKGYLMTQRDVEHTTVQFYTKRGANWAENKIDSMIIREIALRLADEYPGR